MTMSGSSTVEIDTQTFNKSSTNDDKIQNESNNETKLNELQKGNGKRTTPMIGGDKIECPCHNFTALSKIVDVLSSEDRTRSNSMIDWLNGTTDQVAIRERKLLSCGKRFQCRYRYGTSFAILRAIRDACAPFQAVATKPGKTAVNNNDNDRSTESVRRSANRDNSMPSKIKSLNKTENTVLVASYDQSFPPLQQHPGFSNILTPSFQKEEKAQSGKPYGGSAVGNTCGKESGATSVINTLQARKKKSKRRIQPQQIPTTVSESISTLAEEKKLSGSTWSNVPPSSIMGPPTISNQSKGRSMTATSSDTRQPVASTGSSNTIVINILQARKQKPVRPLQVKETSMMFDVASESNSTPIGAFRTPPRNTNNDSNKHQDHSSAVKYEKHNMAVSPSKPSTNVSKATVEQMERLTDIYIALIENMLVPSTPLEVHLLIELLSIDTNLASSNFSGHGSIQQDHSDERTANKSRNEALGAPTGSTLFFQPIFYSPERCIKFAQSALTKMEKGILQRLSPFLIKALLQDGNFSQRCPALAERLNRVLLESTTAADWTPPSSDLVTGTHAIFSLPFEPDRDNRHNFKTPVEIAVYQNREVTRDAFLSELRVFMTAKSKVFLPQEVDNIRETAKYESRKIIGNITPQNILWFAQFFCDLLVQVGLAPVDEMDQELLKIAADDKDKLQKLHKRFSKKIPSRPSRRRAGFASGATGGNRRNERYRTHNANNNHTHGTTPTFQQALSYFPGYQEFFFIFLYSVNSYNFGIHLLHQVVKKMSDMVSNQSSSGLEKRTLELALLGRFLGFLVFSPNWQEEGIDLNKLKPCICSLDNGLNQLESVGLHLPTIVQEAWDGGYTFLTIPWVTELLKMSKWDSISQSSMNYRQILANLRLVQRHASQPSSDENKVHGSHMQLLSFHLETFFHGTFSLPKLTSLPHATIAPVSQAKTDSLDNRRIRLSTAAIYASSPDMEDLCDVITNVAKASTRQEIKRKLRPSIVSTAVGTEARSYFIAESPGEKVMSPLSKATWKKSPLDKSAHGKKIHAKNKLAEGFFHQHRDLKRICDFAVDQTLKTLAVEEVYVFVSQVSEELQIGIESTETEIEEMQTRAFELSRCFVKSKLMKNLTSSLELFCHPDMQRRVIDVATNLSIVRGIESSQSIVRGLITSSTNMVLKDKQNKENSQKTKRVEVKTEIDHAIEAATISIRNLQHGYSRVMDSTSDTILIENALECVKTVTKSVSIPRETLLREFFECILDLEPIVESIIDRLKESNTQELWIILKAFFLLLENIGFISVYWRGRLHRLYGKEFVAFVKNPKLPSPVAREKILDQLTRSSTGKRNSSDTDRSIGNDDAESSCTGLIEPIAIRFSKFLS